MSENKITIQGVPPKFDEIEYKSRIDKEVHRYRSTTDCMVHVTNPLPHEFLELVAEKVSEGYKVSRNQRVTTESLYYSCYMVKPEVEQALDIEAIHAKVKADYVAWLQSEHSRYQDLLREQLKQAALAKELKAQQDKQAKQLAEIEKQVQSCYAPLQIPD